jgi:hypothetical protein
MSLVFLVTAIIAQYSFVFAVHYVNFFVFQVNSDSIQEGNQNIHTYFRDKRKKTKNQPPPNSKFVIITMRITKQRLNEASSQDPSIEQNCSDNVKIFLWILCDNKFGAIHICMKWYILMINSLILM